jgi:glycosyltransferase involved in cell wall biosynthesis
MSQKISILLPVFNCELFIKSAIQSIINNSFENYEIIVINDGSTDDTLKVINQFTDSRIKFFNKENSGLIETLNYGLDKCSYSIIMRMDGDDLIHPEKIEKQLDYFLKNQSVLVGTQGFTININDEITGEINLPLSHGKIIKSLLKLSSGLIHPSIMFYKDALLKVGGYNQNFKHAEDYEMYLQLSKIGKISNIKEKLIYLRKHETNVSLIHAEEQIKNSIISKEIYLKSSVNIINKKTYEKYRREVNDKIIYKLYVKIQTSIVYLENNPTMFNFMLVITLKIIRRTLMLII